MLTITAIIHKSPKGKVTILKASDDAEKCVKAYKECDKPGELIYMRKSVIYQRRKIKPTN
jgi:hypothetical protein